MYMCHCCPIKNMYLQNYFFLGSLKIKHSENQKQYFSKTILKMLRTLQLDT